MAEAPKIYAAIAPKDSTKD